MSFTARIWCTQCGKVLPNSRIESGYCAKCAKNPFDYTVKFDIFQKQNKKSTAGKRYFKKGDFRHNDIVKVLGSGLPVKKNSTGRLIDHMGNGMLLVAFDQVCTRISKDHLKTVERIGR
jgi:hypothetical protein